MLREVQPFRDPAELNQGRGFRDGICTELFVLVLAAVRKSHGLGGSQKPEMYFSEFPRMGSLRSGLRWTLWGVQVYFQFTDGHAFQCHASLPDAGEPAEGLGTEALGRRWPGEPLRSSAKWLWVLSGRCSQESSWDSVSKDIIESMRVRERMD